MSFLLKKQSFLKVKDGLIKIRKQRLANLQITTTNPFRKPTPFSEGGGGGEKPQPPVENILLNVGGDDLLVDNEGNFIKVG
tara:strand:- start:272 stop:514 length:243 start_codon:yes stop_codon:yes gene_type:complete